MVIDISSELIISSNDICSEIYEENIIHNQNYCIEVNSERITTGGGTGYLSSFY